MPVNSLRSMDWEQMDPSKTARLGYNFAGEFGKEVAALLQKLDDGNQPWELCLVPESKVTHAESKGWKIIPPHVFDAEGFNKRNPASFGIHVKDGCVWHMDNIVFARPKEFGRKVRTAHHEQWKQRFEPSTIANVRGNLAQMQVAAEATIETKDIKVPRQKAPSGG